MQELRQWKFPLFPPLRGRLIYLMMFSYLFENCCNLLPFKHLCSCLRMTIA